METSKECEGQEIKYMELHSVSRYIEQEKQ